MKKTILVLAAFLSGISAWQISSAAPQICGTDGKTYGNACWADAAEVPVARTGECAAAPVVAMPILGLRPLEIGNGNPFASVLERNRIQRYAISHISQLVTNGSISEGKVSVTKIAWEPLDQKRPRIMDITYRAGGKTFKESFVAAIGGSRILVLPAVKASDTFTLLKGEKAYAYESGVTIELVDLSDSRCPPNVQCIWAGEAVARMKYSRGWDAAEDKNLFEAFGIRLELKKSDYRRYATFVLKP